MKRTTALGLLLLFFAGCCCARGPAPGASIEPAVTAAKAPAYAPPPGTAAPDSTTLVEMRNVHFRIEERLALNIRHLSGTMHPRSNVVDFGDPRSFYIEIARGEVGMQAEDLAYLLNRYVFDYEGAPLTIHSISIEGDRLHQVGILHKVVDIPFEMIAEVSATDDGRIRLHPTAMQICNIPGKGLMSALGVQLGDLIDLSGADGIDAEGNDLLMDPRKLLPPPEFRAEVADVRLENGEIVQVFGARDEGLQIPEPSYPNAENYMFYSGGTLHFGKLFMVRADLQIIDDDPSDPFDFFLNEYLRQLVAGSSETMPDQGLVAYFPDYADVDVLGERSVRIDR